jgi:hypothetical protein
MSRKRKIKSIPGQLSLEDLPGFWEETPSMPAEATASPSRRSTAKEAVSKYQIAPLETDKTTSEKDQNRDLSVPENHCSTLTPLPKIGVYVGITFDPCQGIREIKQQWISNPVLSEVVFDCTPLELAQEYACQPKPDEFFSREEEYLLGRGGFVNVSIFINLLRCYETVAKWSRDFSQEPETKRIKGFQFIRPKPTTPVGKLWDVLGMEELIHKSPSNLWNNNLCSSGAMKFQSRIVTPFLMVNGQNRKEVQTCVQEWLDYLLIDLKRISDETCIALWKLICEVIKNLVEHGHKGVFGLSIWPTGQIELVWSNPIDHLYWWPPEDTPYGLANSLLSSQGGGMPYIYDLLHRYKGLLIINWKTYNLIFELSGKVQLSGLKPRTNDFLPRSILFHLHLFSQETRSRSY